MATPQGRYLGYHTLEQVSNQEAPDSRPCMLTTTLLGGVARRVNHYATSGYVVNFEENHQNARRTSSQV